MSGGSWNYLYSNIEDAAHRLMCDENPLRRALGKKLHPFAKALHDIEWTDSSDYGPDQDVESIKLALGEHWREITLESALQQIDEIKTGLIKTLSGGQE